MDPPFSQFQRSNEVNYNILDQFFRYGWNDTGKGYSIADTGNIEGSAFESWEWSSDKSSLTLTLRKGAKFNKTGKAGIFAGSLELVKEGNLEIRQQELFSDIYIRENK